MLNTSAYHPSVHRTEVCDIRFRFALLHQGTKARSVNASGPAGAQRTVWHMHASSWKVTGCFLPTTPLPTDGFPYFSHWVNRIPAMHLQESD